VTSSAVLAPQDPAITVIYTLKEFHQEAEQAACKHTNGIPSGFHCSSLSCCWEIFERQRPAGCPNTGRAAAGSTPILVGESQFRTLTSFGKHVARKPLCQTLSHTPHDRFHLDRLRAPAKPSRQSRVTSSRFHASDQSALDTRRNRASAQPQAGSSSADQGNRQAKPTCAVAPVLRHCNDCMPKLA
jgi:hypothetical protein